MTSAKVTLADGSVVEGVVRLVSPRVDATTRLGRVQHQPAGPPGYPRRRLRPRHLPWVHPLGRRGPGDRRAL